MKKVLITAAATALLAAAAWPPPAARAEVNVNVVVPLPGLVIPVPPAMIVIPGSYVYYPPGIDVDIFFFHGYWYRPYGGHWYRATDYNGPWRGVAAATVPRAVLHVPPHFRSMSPRHDHVPYPSVRKNWRAWERDRYWDHDRREQRNGKKERERHDRGERGRRH